MSLFTEYEKLKAARKSLTIGSLWELEPIYGHDRFKTIATIIKVNSTYVEYTYSFFNTTISFNPHLLESVFGRGSRSIEAFKGTFRPVL